MREFQSPLMFRADLHTHTTCSDGSLTPAELVIHAKKVGLSALCITDHDNIDAYPAAIAKAQEIGICLGTGVEFSSVFNEISVHILGYDIDLHHPALIDLCQRHKLRRIHRNRAILAKLAARGMSLSEEELMQRGSNLGRPHIAELMVQKGYIANIKQAFQLYIGDDQPCFVRGETISSEETIAVIHQAGGKAFIAHPHLIDSQRKVRELFKLSFDGIECHYARFLPEQEKRWIQEAKARQLLISGGSDFHGAAKPHIPLGCSWVDETTFNTIFQRQSPCSIDSLKLQG